MNKTAKITFNKTGLSISLSVADDNVTRNKGLMDIHYLDPNSGMLFIFDQNSDLMFWNKNTYIPLTVIFINDKMRVVDIQNMSPFTENGIKYNRSYQPAKYVIEVNKGFNIQNNITIGDRITINNIYYS